MQCPRCLRTEVEEVQLKSSGVTVNACRRCRGVWFDAGELEELLKVAAKDLRVPKGAQQWNRPCPRCGRQLFHFRYPQTFVEVDMCKKCRGLWLDGKELEEIKAVREHLRKTRQLEQYAPAEGLRGAMLRFIDVALEALAFW